MGRGTSRHEVQILGAPTAKSIDRKRTPRVNCIIDDKFITLDFFYRLCYVWKTHEGASLGSPFGLSWHG